MKDALSICWEGRAAATAWRVAQRGLTVSHPDHRPTTWLCGGKSKAQRPIKGTKHWPGSQKSGVQTSAPPPPGCVTLGKSRSLPVPQAPHL